MKQTFKIARSGLTIIEVLVILGVLAVIIALLLPNVEAAREAARRIACNNNVKQIALALHNYNQANRSKYPPGTICGSRPTNPGNQYNVWAEAGETGPENHGTSFLLSLMPYLEYDSTVKLWASGTAGSGTTAGCWSPAANLGDGKHPGPAIQNIKSFYCPSRRSGLRLEDRPIMLSNAWTGGGTDYGGCAGRYAAFTLKTGYNLCDATMDYKPGFCPVDPADNEKIKDNEKTRWGIFGRVNVSTKSKEIKDGAANTLMVGELSRIVNLSENSEYFNANTGLKYSKDGWSIGGPATLFTTGAAVSMNGTTMIFGGGETLGKSSNNGFFGSPGSEHNNGANYGFADTSVRFISTNIDPNIFALMGSMADGADLSKEDEQE